MLSEESSPISEATLPTFELGQPVFDRDGNLLGKVRARFSKYILVERGTIFVKAYYVPHSAISDKNDAIYLSLSEYDLRQMGLNHVPDDLYIESPELGVPDVMSGTAKIARGPLSPAETGHYNYGKYWPGMNTDASGSYHRGEVIQKPQEFFVEEKR